jgi:hypothetical protein
MPAVVRYQVSRGDADCALVALSIYLQVGYEDVLGAAVRVSASDQPHNRGLFTREIKRVALRLGATLKLRRSFDPDEDEGICGFIRGQNEAAHVAYVKRGLVWDTDGTIWEMDAYLAATAYRPVSLLERVN